MTGIVVVTHGQLAIELVTAAETIVGDLPHITGVSIGWHDDVDVARRAIAEAIDRVRSVNGGVVILTDMFGGTPSNLAMTFLSTGQVEVVTGVNLAMLIKAAQLPPGGTLAAAARLLADHGRHAIWVATELLQTPPVASEPR
ncbi:MAG: PTS sugar transporter subunit IIA [Acidobacteria bacterium]|nr:PTS sugar transporter subunit IIA [Acidobacteriota bacterium]